MKEKILKERGITLIALVITIIVLLILAGVTISIVLHTGIIDNSQKAVDLYEANAKNEVKQLDELTLKIQTQFGILDNTDGKENQTITGEKSAYNNPVIPVGFKTSNEGASWKSSDGETVDGWNSGLVIEDKDGNQFVWVPCYIKENEDQENSGLVEYTKTLGPKNNANLDGGKFEERITDDELPEGITEEELQIKTYGGFYIARYEAGIPEDLVEKLSPEDAVDNPEKMKEARNVEGIPVSKKNQVPWGDITYTQAKINAEQMYSNDNVQSCLITGKMWDTTLQWLLKTGAVTDDEINNDSKSWGNYITSTIPGVTSRSEYIENLIGIEWIDEIATKPGIDRDEPESYSQYSWLLKTGNTEYTKRNNIYDLAGNLWEFTTELCDVSYHNRRGGMFLSFSQLRPVSFRYNIPADEISVDTGFRVALYIL